MESLKNISRRDFNVTGDYPDQTNLVISALMRIADATEVMASNYAKMQSDLDYCKRRIQEQNAEIAELKKSRSALRGVVTRLKK